MALKDPRRVDTAGDAAVLNASVRSDYEPLMWYTTSEWCDDERIRTTVKYRLKGGKNVEELMMDFEFEISELIGLLYAGARKDPRSWFNALNIVQDEGAWRASRFALINDLKTISEERDWLRRQIADSTKVNSIHWDWMDDHIGKFEGLKDVLRSVTLCDTIIWLSKKPKGWSAFLELLEKLQPKPVTVNS